MKKVLFLLIAMAGVCLPIHANDNSQYVVQVYSTEWKYENGLSVNVANLIFPDGAHAKGLCIKSPFDRPCHIESFAPENHAPDACTQGWNEEKCTYQENYYAERRGNDIVIYAAKGKVVYHITGSW